jgi:hypothetical protein
MHDLHGVDDFACAKNHNHGIITLRNTWQCCDVQSTWQYMHTPIPRKVSSMIQIKAISQIVLFIATLVLGAYLYVQACTRVASIAGGLLIGTLGSVCPAYQDQATITPLTNAQIVRELKQMKQLVAAQGTYQTTFAATNDQVDRWKELQQNEDASFFDKSIAYLDNAAQGQVFTVTVIGDVYASVDFDVVDTSAIVIKDQTIHVTLQGPHILSTHVNLAVLKTDTQQGILPWLARDESVRKDAYADIDRQLVEMACKPPVSVDMNGRTVRPINEIARKSATDVIATLMQIAHPDYRVDVTFVNETCELPVGSTYTP